MKYIFVGGVAIIATLGWKNEKYVKWMLEIITLGLLFQKELYYSIIFAGGICFYLVDSNTKNKRKNQIPYIFLLLLALLLGSYPSGVVPTNIFYRVLKLSVDYDYLCQIWHYVAAVMFFCV